MSNFWGALQNDGHYFCGAGGNRPDGLNEPVTFTLYFERRLGLNRPADHRTDCTIPDSDWFGD
ncbi:hypothetical protein D7N80_17705 [Salmonella enterica subsp. enterica]|uniref:Copper resistance protein n=1 Tax=Salmonella enterica I TaxID=59201 RepID=A0A403QJT3_SALET|nr:hypothetical protein [Salmonella enterica subsp. enterica serovar Kidderminster]